MRVSFRHGGRAVTQPHLEPERVDLAGQPGSERVPQGVRYGLLVVT